MSHLCPSPGCNTQVSDAQFACRGHWFCLPEGMRNEINAAYRQEPLSDRHLAAMRQARTFLAARPDEAA